MSNSNRTAGSQRLTAGALARFANGMRGMMSVLRGDAWFSPGEPLQAQEQGAGRSFPYPIGVNINYTPKVGEGITFQQLRNFANYDIVRLAIETRKDQLGALEFEIIAKDGKNTPKTRVKRIYEALAYPDKQHPWSTWLRLLVEDLLVIDAPTVCPRFTRGGDLYSLEAYDGSTIHRIIDYRGATPLPLGTNPLRVPVEQEVAYQQVLYGTPAVNFARDQLIYMPRNPRTHKMYGFSPVEQIIKTIDIALRRQSSQQEYFTEGSIPDVFIETPEGWTPDMIALFDKNFNAVLEGDTAQRRKAKFIPNGSKATPIREPDLKTEYDEWLARIVCFAFSLPPTAFITQINRSMAEAAQETALQEGLSPLKLWVKELMDYVLQFYFDSPDLQFAWQAGEAEQDPLTKAQIHHIYVTDGILTKDEAREEMGLPPFTAEQLAQQQQAADAQQEQNPQDSNKQNKKIPSISQDQRATEKGSV